MIYDNQDKHYNGLAYLICDYVTKPIHAFMRKTNIRFIYYFSYWLHLPEFFKCSTNYYNTQVPASIPVYNTKTAEITALIPVFHNTQGLLTSLWMGSTPGIISRTTRITFGYIWRTQKWATYNNTGYYKWMISSMTNRTNNYMT